MDWHRYTIIPSAIEPISSTLWCAGRACTATRVGVSTRQIQEVNDDLCQSFGMLPFTAE